MSSSRPLAWALIACAALYVGSVIAERPQKVGEAEPAPAAAGPSTAPAITLTFWNVEWFPGRKPNPSQNARDAHLAAVAPVLEKLNPDLLGLEEVADQAAAQSVANHLKGFKVDVCSQFPLPDSSEIGRQQVVLCSRLPVLQAWAEPWKPGPDGLLPRRGFVVAAYQPAPGQVLLVYGLHLKSNRVDTAGGEPDNVAMREESARQLLAHVKAMTAAYAALGKVSVVIGGDLNTSLDDPRFAAETTLPDLQAAGFQWVWRDVPLSERYTLPGAGHYPATCFDHLFWQSATARLTDGFVEPTGKDCSDHRPVTARLTL